MGFAQDLHDKLERLSKAVAGRHHFVDRLRHEVEFASRLAAARPEQQKEWEKLILKAVDSVRQHIESDAPKDMVKAVTDAEAMLAPIGQAAKEYTIHCAGHAHIDMNWMWPWPETVSVTYDTFTTMDRLMQEFPEFRFSQSQASVYLAMQQYAPELFRRIKQRVREKKWDVTASQWVEGDKNLASGEILCRHLLYTKRWLRDNLGLPLDAVKVDWECDTFGHAHTLPGILRRGGVTRYYFHRAGKGHRLFWWQGKDGSRLLAFDDAPNGYNGQIGPGMTRLLFDFEKATGMKDLLFVHGVGDHGGGPTRQQILTAKELNSWPIFPNVKLSTTAEFFDIAERTAKNLPVVDAELNFVFPGCYTSQSNVKRGNRMCENALTEAESVAVIAGAAAGFPYPSKDLLTGWRHTMFNQFHDILPGSGVHATYEYAQGLFQEVLAITNSTRTRGLRALAAAVDTAKLAPKAATTAGPGLGGGAGDKSWYGGLSTLGAGSEAVDPFLVFNPSPWPRSEVITAKVWNRDLPGHQIVVTDDKGKVVRGQQVEDGHYWGHRFITVAFPVKDVPALGYRTYAISRSVEPPPASGVTANDQGVLENEFLRLQVEPASGAITSLIDKRTGYDLALPGYRIGLLQLQTEVPHGMTAWEIGQIARTHNFLDDGAMRVGHRGPHLASIISTRKYHDSSFTLTISLAAGSPRVDFHLNVNWLERGTPETGVPMLKAAFAFAVEDAKATCEVPCGFVTRPTDGREVPALRWVDLSGKGIGKGAPEAVGATLVNDTKYGHNLHANAIQLTLLRSSYDPDPLPELGQHEIKFALIPHVGAWSASASTCGGQWFNHPLSVVATDLHEGDLPTSKGFLAIENSNVMLSGMKKAEDGDALIIRLYEMEGKQTKARVKLDKSLLRPRAKAVETDVLEQPLSKNTASLAGDTLTVTIPPFGIATVKVG